LEVGKGKEKGRGDGGKMEVKRTEEEGNGRRRAESRKQEETGGRK
jgi:hypothetical protein